MLNGLPSRRQFYLSTAWTWSITGMEFEICTGKVVYNITETNVVYQRVRSQDEYLETIQDDPFTVHLSGRAAFVNVCPQMVQQERL